MVTSPAASHRTMRRVADPQRKRRADAERNIAAIVDAALELFTEHSDVSMTDVAKAAGVGRVTLYAHFPSREDLVEAVVDRVLTEAAALLRVDGFDTAPADVVLAQLARSAWRTLRRYQRLRAVASAALGDQRLRARHDQAGFTDRLDELVARGQRDGTIRADLPAEWLIALYYSVMHAAADEVEAGWLAPAEVPDLLEATLRPMLAPRPRDLG
jgi:TetR/AcrR family transcriptional repressor of mexCD-oprJ operon